MTNQPGKCVFSTLLDGETEEVLIDSGADGSFISSKIARRRDFNPVPLEKPYKIMLANGHQATVSEKIEQVPYEIQGYQGTVDLHVTPLDLSAVIFGNQWLSDERAKVDFFKKEITLEKDAKIFTIKANKEKPYRIIGPKTLSLIWKHERNEAQFLKIDAVRMAEEAKKFYDKDHQEINNPKLEALLNEYKDVFQDKLPPTRPTRCHATHHIELKEGAKPLRMSQYRLSPEHCRIIQQAVQELIDLGHVEPSTSAWRSPVIVVLKKDGIPRVVYDFRGLNNLTKDISYPMKFQEELLEAMARGRIWCVLDLTSGYHHIWLASEDKEKTAFAIPGLEGGFYQFKVMPFGLKGAPATFQRIMDSIFQSILGKFAVVYIDDLGIFSQTEEEQINHLKQVFQLMRENEIYAKQTKCFFLQTKVPYLSHYITQKGIEMDPKKVEALTNWPNPTSLKGL